MKVSSLNRGLKQTEQEAPQLHLLPIAHSLLPFTGQNFYKERWDVVMQDYVGAKKQSQSITVTLNYFL